MQPLQFLVPIHWLESYADALGYLILLVALLNVGTRFLAHRKHLRQAEEGDDDALEHYLPHTATTVALVLLSFAFMIVEPHGGMVLSVLVLAVFFADFFEFEARLVEVRNKMEVERPKAGIAASALVILYAGYLTVFSFVAPYWNSIV